MSIHASTLHKAAVILGGERALARYLRVSMPDLFVWMRAAAPPPDNVFLRAVDIVFNDLELSEQQRAQSLRIAAAHGTWAE